MAFNSSTPVSLAAIGPAEVRLQHYYYYYYYYNLSVDPKQVLLTVQQLLL